MATGVPDGVVPGADGPDVPGGAPGQLPTQQAKGWTAGRVIALVAGSVLALVSLGLLGGGGALLWADQELRQDGYVTTGTVAYSTSASALASEPVTLGWGWLLVGLVGDVRLRVTADSPGRPVFVGIGPADRVAAYLSGTSYTTVTGQETGGLVSHYGANLPTVPQRAGIWAVQVAGTGTQTLRWTAQDGEWTAVAMNPDGSPGVAVRADASVSAPGLLRVGTEIVTIGVVLAALAAALVWVPVRLAAGER